MKMRTRKFKVARCRMHGPIESGVWNWYKRRGERNILKVRAERVAYMNAWRAEQAWLAMVG